MTRPTLRSIPSRVRYVTSRRRGGGSSGVLAALMRRQLLPLVIVGFALSQGVALAQGPLTNGDNHTGSISPSGDVDSWTFSANQGDSISLSIGVVGTPTLRPSISLRDPFDVEVATNAGASIAQVNITAAQNGTYTVRVTSGAGVPTGTGSYVITLAKTPGAFVVAAGDEGGAMTNGANHTGVISLGDLDMWSFTANAGDSISLSIGVVDTGVSLRPFIRLRNPNGVEVGTDSNVLLAQINATAAQAGTYTVVIASGAGVPTGTGSYVLTLAQTPAAFVVPAGDEGGAMTNGANHSGAITLGDLDQWTFTANAGDSISLSIGLVDPSATLRPFIRLRNPNGVEVGSDASTLRAAIDITAAQGGLYTLVVGSGAGIPTGTGSYVLTLAQTPGAFVVSAGDEGGAMTNGANHPGAITLGDLDQWTFTAAQGDSISLSIGLVDPSATLRPFIRLRAPNGVEVGSAQSLLLAQINVTAAQAGTYTVVAASGSNFPQGTGSYVIALAKTPGTFIVSPGDEGGPMTNGASHAGVITLGDLDMWTFSAAQGDSISLSIGVVGSPSLRPFIRLRDPNGVEVASAANLLIAQVDVTAAQTGVYTLVVASGFGFPQGTGSYVLTLAQTPGAFIVSPGDEGGSMTNGANHAGAINLGDLDMWTFTAAQGDAISLSVGVVGSATLRPFIRLRNPNGVEIGSAANFLIAQINVTAPQAGLYTVVVASGFSLPQGTGSYLLTLAKTPGTFIVPAGDEGGFITDGSHPGSIHLGDLDQWTFNASQGHAISLSMGVVGNPTLRPFIRLRDPNGVEVDSKQSVTLAQINITATQTGLYTVVAASGFSVPQGTGSYLLNLTGSGFFFTDDPLIPGVTVIKAVHITELRARINALRLSFSLAAFVFTDASLTGVVVKPVHILELRTALLDAYVAAVRTAPIYTDLTLTPQLTFIKVVHIMELRAAVLALE